MRLAIVVILVGVVAAHAGNDKAPKELRPYANKLVLSPDTPPSTLRELPAFLQANYDKSGHYELLTRNVHFVGVLAHPAAKVTLVVADGATQLVSIELAVTRQVVIGELTPTKAAGFVGNKPYQVTLATGKVVVGKAELVLRE